MASDDIGSATFPLWWDFYDPPDQPHHRMWTLKAGLFAVGEVWHSMADWCWQICGHEHRLSGERYKSLEEAQAALVQAVKENANDKS